MTSILNSLMTGGYDPDNSDVGEPSEFDLWYENMETKLFEMPYDELCRMYIDASIDGDEELAKMCEHEMNGRKPVADMPPYSTLAYEPIGIDDPEHEDRRKDYLENYCPVEQDELPF